MAFRAAVDAIFATNRLQNRTKDTNGSVKQSGRLSEDAAGGGEVGLTDVRQRTAAPSAALRHEAAGRVPGAAGFAVARRPVRTSRAGNEFLGRDVLQRRELLQPGEPERTGAVARLLGHVAHVALWTAVLTIAAANGLRGRRTSMRYYDLSPS